MHTECSADAEGVVCLPDTTELTDVHNNIIFSTGEGLYYYRGMSQMQPCRRAGVTKQHGIMYETSHP